MLSSAAFIYLALITHNYLCILMFEMAFIVYRNQLCLSRGLCELCWGISE